MTVKFLVFQHVSWEGPGLILKEAAQEFGAVLNVIHVWENFSVPELSTYDAMLVLGGGPNVDQEKEYPFLVEEKEIIRRALAIDMPYFGICLGHQLLAEALGSVVGPNFCPSVGFVQGHLTTEGREHPVFKGVESELPLFKWHGQAVQTPVKKNISILATSEECQVEAISVPGRPHVVGMQFDNHAASPADVSVWLEKDRKWVFSLRERVINPMVILSFARKYEKRVRADFRKIFSNFIKLAENHSG